MEKNVTIIPQRSRDEAKRIPVAVYCRVSTKAERQGDSLENQIEHYTEAIGDDPRYELVEIYYDFGISGFKDTRPGFQRMMDDAEAGRFRQVITKAITRFARNTRTVLDSTRRLKELGIGVYFELQGIDTLSQEGELLMTLFAAFGQAESEGARMHTLMALKRKYEEGRPPRQLQRSMGYSKGEDGEFYPDEYAPLVLEMYEMAADGYTAGQITNYLNAEGITNHNGCAFHRASVTRLLRNPAYKGDFIAQQYYVNEDRRLVKNGGEKPMYYIEEDHIPIVTRQLWERAQETLNAATHKAVPTESQPMELNDENYPYRHQLFCSECGHRLQRAVRAGRVLWECSGKARFSQDFCAGVTVTDDEVRSWLPLADGGHYVSATVEKGKITGHAHEPEAEWEKTHRRKNRSAAGLAPELTEENYPYMNRVFCKYCGSRLRRIVSNAGKVTWLCDGLSRQGKQFCKGIRVPDEKLKPLAGLAGDFYIGKEKVNGTEGYGYSRKPDRRK
ncbi:MAG: recombinase family protein [Clostridia bacterium]|nr:recombinase family protein [Clostridia bacterium]